MSRVYPVEAYSYASRFSLREVSTWLPGEHPIRWAKTQFVVELNGGVCQKVRLAIGAVGRTPQRLPQAERALLDKALDADCIEDVASVVVELVDPTIDLRASADFRRELAGKLTRRALHQIAS